MTRTPIEEAIAALEFYAEPSTHAPHPHGSAFDGRRDNWRIAKSALDRINASPPVGYDPHFVRAAAQLALDDICETRAIDLSEGGDPEAIDFEPTEAGIRIIEDAMVRLLAFHGVTKRKPV